MPVNGTDVTDDFHADRGSRTLTGLVDDLVADGNRIRAWVRGRADAGAALEATNHPVEGPVFSGPHQQPYASRCEQLYPSASRLPRPVLRASASSGEPKMT